MQWTDEGIVIAVRPHGETLALLEVFTRGHGRHLGLVHGGRSRRLRPLLQTGNHLDLRWTARLDEQLGTFAVELKRGHAGEALDRPLALLCLESLAGLLRLLPERDPHPALFEVGLFVLAYLAEDEVWPAIYARWELALLDGLGFGLDLERCAVTGVREGLAFVSPRTGRAVSRAGAGPYADRLLRLPPLLVGGRPGSGGAGEVSEALALTGHFLAARVLAPRGLRMPEARERLVRKLLERAA